MSAQRPDTCPTGSHILPGVGIVVICDVCSCITYPLPEYPPNGPLDGRVYAWTGSRWLPVFAADLQRVVERAIPLSDRDRLATTEDD